MKQVVLMSWLPIGQVAHVVAAPEQVAQLLLQAVQTPADPNWPVGQLVQKARSEVLQVGHPLKQAVQLLVPASFW